MSRERRAPRARRRHAPRSAGLSLLEVVAAISLALVLMGAVLPPIDRQVGRVAELYEREAARLLLEGELARAQDGALVGRLAAGSVALEAPPALGARLLDLAVRRSVVPRGDLLEVTVHASWRSRAPGAPRAPRSISLATYVAAGGRP